MFKRRPWKLIFRREIWDFRMREGFHGNSWLNYCLFWDYIKGSYFIIGHKWDIKIWTDLMNQEWLLSRPVLIFSRFDLGLVTTVTLQYSQWTVLISADLQFIPSEATFSFLYANFFTIGCPSLSVYRWVGLLCLQPEGALLEQTVEKANVYIPWTHYVNVCFV